MKDVGEKKIRNKYWMIFNEFSIAEFMLSDCINLGKKLARGEILKMLDEDIKIQREFLKKEPEHKKSIEWRIIGMILLKDKIKGDD